MSLLPVVVPEMIALVGGSFWMGSVAGRPDERPAHRVELPRFRAAIAPVSNAEYARFVAGTGHEPAPFVEDPRFSDAAQPVVGVNWHEANAYCEWLGATTGIPIRLPTEAEREYAARGGFEGDWPWEAESEAGHPAFAFVASRQEPHVPELPCANAYGLWCMTENVHEWCIDWYDPAYYAASPVLAPTGPSSGRRKASRGGAWRHSNKFTRVNARSSLDPSFRYSDYGFRVYA